MSFPYFSYDGTKAVCADGVERTFHQTAHADTFFSVPGFVYVQSKRVYGWLGSDTLEDGETVFYKFSAYTYRKNHHLIPVPPKPLIEVLA